MPFFWFWQLVEYKQQKAFIKNKYYIFYIRVLQIVSVWLTYKPCKHCGKRLGTRYRNTSNNSLLYGSNLNDLPLLIILTLEECLTEIGADVCTQRCSELKTLTIGKVLATWTNGAFSSCSKLHTITVSAKNPEFKVIDNALCSIDGETKYLSSKT